MILKAYEAQFLYIDIYIYIKHFSLQLSIQDTSEIMHWTGLGVYIIWMWMKLI